MAGGAAIGLAGGWLLAQSLKRLPIEDSLAPVLVLTGGLADPHRDERLFASIFILVIASLVVQGWTVAPAARLLGFGLRVSLAISATQLRCRLPRE